ncbi:HY3/Hydin-like protein, partial [Acrasis kona]
KIELPNQLIAVPNYIDVPAFSKREYKFTFLPYKEGVYEGKITFLNETTKEFIFYNVKYTAKPSKNVKTIKLESRVRQRALQTISIDNPLNKDTKLSIKCSNVRHLYLSPGLDQQLVIPANGTGKLDVVYLPLFAETDEERDINVFNDELGQFTFKLKLTATATGPEKNVHFKVSLGNSQTQTIRFLNYFTQGPTEYSIKLQGNNFSLVNNGENKNNVLKVGQATNPDGTEESIDVNYEPSAVGDCKDKLILTSKQGGEYVFLLFGLCTAPQPQGPIEISNGATQTITFKNVLNNKSDFKFNVDSPYFTVKPDAMSLASKQKQQVVVSFKQNLAQSATTPTIKKKANFDEVSSPTNASIVAPQSVHAKLTVVCKDNPTTWMYYLYGKSTK